MKVLQRQKQRFPATPFVYFFIIKAANALVGNPVDSRKSFLYGDFFTMFRGGMIAGMYRRPVFPAILYPSIHCRGNLVFLQYVLTMLPDAIWIVFSLSSLSLTPD